MNDVAVTHLPQQIFFVVYLVLSVQLLNLEFLNGFHGVKIVPLLDLDDAAVRTDP